MSTNPMVAKVGSLVLAVLLWSIAIKDVNPVITKEQTVKIVPRNIAKGLVLLKKPGNAKIEYSVHRQDAGDVNVRNISAYVDLEGLGKGEHILDTQITVPIPAKYNNVEPELNKYVLDILKERQIAVEYQLVGEPKQGFTVTKVMIDPMKITLKGASSVVDSVAKVMVPLDITGSTSIVDKDDVRPKAMDKDGKELYEEGDVLKLLPQKIRVTAHLQQILATQAKKVELKSTGKLPAGLKLQSIQISDKKINGGQIKLRGKEEVLNTIKVVPTEPIDLAKLKKGENIIKVKLKLEHSIVAEVGEVEVRIVVVEG